MESIISYDKPKITVVLNTRNRCRLLPRSIESALRQTFKQLELIVVDGASTDDTKLVVEEFIRKDNRVKYLYVPENKSAAYCINLGFKQALGEYIAILDDDDEFYPEKLEKQLAVMEKGGDELGIVYCWEEYWDDKEDKFLRYGKEYSRGLLYYNLLKGPCTGGGTLMLVRKSAIEEIGGYDETIRFGADYQFNLNISKKFKHDFVPEVLSRTHWNHEYLEFTTQPGSRIKHEAVIEYYEKILSDHKDAYDLRPEFRFKHYRSIMHSAAKINNYKTFFYYMKLGLSIKNLLKVKVLYVLRGIKHLIIK